MNSIKKIILVFVVFVLNAGVDRYTKYLAQQHLQGEPTIQVIGDFFILRYAENTGAFLSMGSGLGDTWRFLLLSIFPSIMLVGFAVYIFRTKQMGTLQLVGAVSLIAGGASNLVDRFLYDGRVVDFLNFGIGNLRTGILNIADLSIVGGVIVLFFTMKPEPPKSTDSPKS